LKELALAPENARARNRCGSEWKAGLAENSGY
jgi:hypothetical protein